MEGSKSICSQGNQGWERWPHTVLRLKTIRIALVCLVVTGCQTLAKEDLRIGFSVASPSLESDNGFNSRLEQMNFSL